MQVWNTPRAGSRLIGLTAKLALTFILPVGAVLSVLLPLSFPIFDPRYEALPTVLPALGGLVSGASAAVIAFRYQSRPGGRAVKWACVAGFACFAVSWYLALFIVLNLKGS
jgi:hypothetical protein